MAMYNYKGIKEQENTGFELIPDCYAQAEIVKVEPRIAGTGTEYFNVQFKITEGDHRGRVLFDILAFTERSAGLTKHKLNTIYYEVSPADDNDFGFKEPEAGQDWYETIPYQRWLKVVVGIRIGHDEYNGKEKNIVSEWVYRSEIDKKMEGNDDSIPF